MAGFYGNYLNALDPKGRLAIPAKIRYSLPEGQRNQLYLTRGIEECITGYSFDEWQIFLKQLDRIKVNEKTKRQLKRQFLGKAVEAIFDKQGRITLPADLLKFAHLENCSEALVVGSGDVVEIWNRDLYEAGGVASEDVVQEIMAEKSLDEVGMGEESLAT